MHAYTHVHSHIRTLGRTHARAHTRSYTHTHIRSLAHMHTHSHIGTLAHTQSQTHSLANTHTLAHTHRHALIFAHKHTVTFTSNPISIFLIIFPLFFSFVCHTKNSHTEAVGLIQTFVDLLALGETSGEQRSTGTNPHARHVSVRHA